MNVMQWVGRCAVVVFLSGWLSACAVGQSDNDPFGFGESDDTPFDAPGDQQPQPRRAVENPFGDLFGSAPAATQPGGGGESSGRQQPAPQLAAAPDAGCQCLGESSDAADRINKALAGPLNARGLEFDGDALDEVVTVLSSEYHIPIQIDARALLDAGLGPDEPVTVNMHGISLRSALNHMLRQHDLTCIIQNEVLLITTKAEAEQQRKICVYDVRDLIDGPKDKAGIETLIGAIRASLATESWANTAGGPGSISPLPPGLLVVSQTHAVHEQIRDLLAIVRRMRARPVAGADFGRGGGFFFQRRSDGD